MNSVEQSAVAECSNDFNAAASVELIAHTDTNKMWFIITSLLLSGGGGGGLVSGQQFNISTDGGCLKCGNTCLNSVTDALPSCLAPILMAVGAAAGVPIPDLGITGDVVSCVKRLVGSTTQCKECVESLVCCVTDSCKYVYSLSTLTLLISSSLLQFL